MINEKPLSISDKDEEDNFAPLAPHVFLAQGEVPLSLEDSLKLAIKDCDLQFYSNYINYGRRMFKGNENPNLTEDQFISIYLYCSDMREEKQVFKMLNADLVNQDRSAASKWRFYLYYFFGGIKNIPPSTLDQDIYRGVAVDVVSMYPKKYVVGNELIWNSFTSTSLQLKTIKHFLSETTGRKTIFAINGVFSGRSIADISPMKHEQEILLPPGSTFKIISILHLDTYDLIQLKQVAPFEKQLSFESTTSKQQIPKISQQIRQETPPSPNLKLSENAGYPSLFKQFKETLLIFVNQNVSMQDVTTKVNQILDTNTPKDIWVFLEVLEWFRMGLRSDEKQIMSLKSKVDVAKNIKSIAKKPPLDLLNPVLKAYLPYLKEDSIHKPELQQNHDMCVVLLAVSILNTDSIKDLTEEKLLELTKCHVYGPLLPILSLKRKKSKSPAQRLWRMLLQGAEAHLPLQGMRDEINRLEEDIKKKQPYYLHIKQTWMNHYHINGKNWKWQGIKISSPLLSKCCGSKGIIKEEILNLTHPFIPENRLWISSENPNIAVLMGNTYFNMDKPHHPEKTLCLDANYQYGHTGATSHGYGRNPAENLKIHQTAYQTAKHMTRYVYTLYTDPTTLAQEIQELFYHVGQSVKYTFGHPAEAGCCGCVVTRTFETEEGLVLVAAGVGDGLVAVFDPEEGIFKTIIKPRYYRRGSAVPAPLFLTENLAKTRIQVKVIKVSPHAIILRMTNGAWKALHSKRSEPIPDGEITPGGPKLSFMEFTLLCDKELELYFQQLLQKTNNIDDLQDALLKKVTEEIERERKNILMEREKLKRRIEEFMGVHPNVKCVVGDWIKFDKEKNPQLKKELQKFLKNLNIEPSDIEKRELIELSNQLDHVGFGDDTTIHLQTATFGLSDKKIKKSQI